MSTRVAASTRCACTLWQRAAMPGENSDLPCLLVLRLSLSFTTPSTQLPMASFSAKLYVGGQSFPVLHCSYGVSQATHQRGQVSTKVRYEPVQLTLDVPASEVLLAWAASTHKQQEAAVVFDDGAGGSPLETLRLNAAYCVGYHEQFRAGDTSTGAYVCHLVLSDPAGFTIQPGGPAAAFVAPAAREHGVPGVDGLGAMSIGGAIGADTQAVLPLVGPSLETAAMLIPPLPKMRTGAETGLPPTPDSIRTGEVTMEQHPAYSALVQQLAERGYPLVVQEKGPPHVVFKRICDKQGNILREDKYVAVVAGMRFLDLEHEAGHVEQLEGNLGGNLPTGKFVLLPSGREVPVDNAPDVLQGWQDSVTEYHVRLLEYQRLTDRGASSELLSQHRAGIEEARRNYNGELFKRGPDKKKTAWAKQYFPELNDLMQQYSN